MFLLCRRDAPKSTSLGEASKSLQHGFLGLLWLYTSTSQTSFSGNTFYKCATYVLHMIEVRSH